MRFEDIEKGQKVAVKMIEYAPNKADEYVAKDKRECRTRRRDPSTSFHFAQDDKMCEGFAQDDKKIKEAEQRLPGRPRKIKSIKKGVVMFKNKFFFGVKKKNGFVECFTRAEMECGELEVDKE